jgi:transaldolase
MSSFSLWCDFIERDFLKKDFLELLDTGAINGATSNPSIFKNAFLTSKAYEEDKRELKNSSAFEIYETLAIKDISLAADRLETLYQADSDGFISIEVDPRICFDTDKTIEQGRYLYKKIAKENVMIKIPATKEGYEAMTTLISEGIPVNATLVFSPSQSLKCLEAFEEGFKIFRTINPEKESPQAVISVFVSRFDRELDGSLSEKGKVGIYNATKIYHQIESRGLNRVRALFASTGVKDDSYPKDYYIRELSFKNSINTAPLDAIEAYIDSGDLKIKEPVSIDTIDQFFIQVKNEGVDIDRVYEVLLDRGLKDFMNAFEKILEDIG